jgi:cystathionine gamma-synthase
LKNLATQLIHGTDNHPIEQVSVVSDLVLSTTFERNKSGDFAEGQDVYTRSSNPNRRELESKLALLENGTSAFAFSSGQAATLSIFHALGGQHIIIPDDMYYNGRVLLEQCFKHRNLTFSVVDMTDLDAVEAAIKPETSLIWIETPSNPLLKFTDITAVTSIAKKHTILTACDNTWATPFHIQPFKFGVDVVMHSTTKYLGGHSDTLGGCVILNESSEHLKGVIADFQKYGGGVPSPFDCWLLNRSLATFILRMPVHAVNAMKLATFLNEHDIVERVNYPGLETNIYHEVAKKHMQNGFSGMMSILLDMTENEIKKRASNMKYFKHATSLGGVESLVEHRRSVEGDNPTSPINLLRISVGIENIQDLMDDFDKFLTR